MPYLATPSVGRFMLGFVFLALIVGAYFLPTIIAALRHHHNTAMIAVLNAFLGWTFVGWVVFLAMSFSNPAPVHYVYSAPTPAPTAVDQRSSGT